MSGARDDDWRGELYREELVGTLDHVGYVHNVRMGAE